MAASLELIGEALVDVDRTNEEQPLSLTNTLGDIAAHLSSIDDSPSSIATSLDELVRLKKRALDV